MIKFHPSSLGLLMTDAQSIDKALVPLDLHPLISKKTGLMKLETQGFSGEACLEATKGLREKLGIDTEPEKTSEFFTGEDQDTVNTGA